MMFLLITGCLELCALPSIPDIITDPFRRGCVTYIKNASILFKNNTRVISLHDGNQMIYLPEHCLIYTAREITASEEIGRWLSTGKYPASWNKSMNNMLKTLE